MFIIIAILVFAPLVAVAIYDIRESCNWPTIDDEIVLEHRAWNSKPKPKTEDEMLVVKWRLWEEHLKVSRGR